MSAEAERFFTEAIEWWRKHHPFLPLIIEGRERQAGDFFEVSASIDYSAKVSPGRFSIHIAGTKRQAIHEIQI